jgi:hypothetical protein
VHVAFSRGCVANWMDTTSLATPRYPLSPHLICSAAPCGDATSQRTYLSPHCPAYIISCAACPHVPVPSRFLCAESPPPRICRSILIAPIYDIIRDLFWLCRAVPTVRVRVELRNKRSAALSLALQKAGSLLPLARNPINKQLLYHSSTDDSNTHTHTLK